MPFRPSARLLALLALCSAAPLGAQPVTASPGQYGDAQSGTFSEPLEGYYGDPSRGDFTRHGFSRQQEGQVAPSRAARVNPGPVTAPVPPPSPYLVLPRPLDERPQVQPRAATPVLANRPRPDQPVRPGSGDAGD